MEEIPEMRPTTDESPISPRPSRVPESSKYSTMPGGQAIGEGSAAVFDGGPLDGSQQAVASEAGELSIVMTDGQQHRYVRTDITRRLPNGRLARVFAWTGRYYGPK
jgi:hypothetical protein